MLSDMQQASLFCDPRMLPVVLLGLAPNPNPNPGLQASLFCEPRALPQVTKGRSGERLLRVRPGDDPARAACCGASNMSFADDGLGACVRAAAAGVGSDLELAVGASPRLQTKGSLKFDPKDPALARAQGVLRRMQRTYLPMMAWARACAPGADACADPKLAM